MRNLSTHYLLYYFINDPDSLSIFLVRSQSQNKTNDPASTPSVHQE